jgi:glycosyltransferase involved in cell wall biosynthesis
MRYIWNMYHGYRSQAGWLAARMMVPLAHYLRMWDVTTAQRVDHFVANSTNTATRIARYYGRESSVIHPPVDVRAFTPSLRRSDAYLSVGELVAYKRPDLLVEAFNRSGLPLTVIGGGEMLESLRQRAAPNVRLLGPQPFEVLRHHYAECRALVFPGEEDFGIVPVEAMASGAPVIARGRGGALETVRHGETGLFFDEPTVDALNAAVTALERGTVTFDAGRIARHAARFSHTVFNRRFSALVDRLLEERKGRRDAVSLPPMEEAV